MLFENWGAVEKVSGCHWKNREVGKSASQTLRKEGRKRCQDWRTGKRPRGRMQIRMNGNQISYMSELGTSLSYKA